MIRDLTELVERAGNRQKRRVAVASAEDKLVLKSVQSAMQKGIITPLLVGDKKEITGIAKSIGFSLKDIEVINCSDKEEAAQVAVSLVRRGDADILMKGLTQTGDLLRKVLNKEKGLLANRLLSHIAFFQSPYYHKLLCVTDAGMNIAPGLEEKVQIINNAARACHLLDIEIPKVAVATAVEIVNPKMEATLHAALLKEMNREGRLNGCIVDGPFAIDIAINREAALHKGIDSEVAGDCDIVLAPDIEAGNMFYKALNFLGGATSAAVITGASAPIVLTSRSDDERSKLFSISLAALMINN